MNKKDKNHCFYGASLLSPVTIFLNENDYITPHLKPSNDVSLHRDKIQTAYYHLQGKGLDGLAPVTFLYLHSYLLHSKLTCLLVPCPQALVLVLLYSYSLLPNLCMMVCFSFSSQLKRQCLRSAFPDYPWPKQGPPITLLTCSHFYFFKAFISMKSTYLFTC